MLDQVRIPMDPTFFQFLFKLKPTDLFLTKDVLQVMGKLRRTNSSFDL